MSVEHEEKTVVEYRRNDLLCKDKFLTKNQLSTEQILIIQNTNPKGKQSLVILV